jgi:hypothetical protein
LNKSPVALFFPPSIATIPSIRLQIKRAWINTAAAISQSREHSPDPTPTNTAPADTEKNTLKTEIWFALTPIRTSQHDNHPAHAEALDFSGLLPAISSEVFME